MRNFRGIILSVTVVVVIFVIVLVNQSRNTLSNGEMAAVKRGEVIYTENCLSCHGETGKGEGALIGTALNNQHFLSNFLNDDINRMIEYGKVEAGMPSYNYVEKEEREDLVSYIRSWQTKPLKLEAPSVIEGNAANGKRVYNAFCSTCHGETGSGFNGAAAAIGHPNTLEFMTEPQLWISIAYGREETRMNSSLKGLDGVRQLEEQEISDVVAYIRQELVKKYDPNESHHQD